MPPLPPKLTFKSWQRSTIFRRGNEQGPRLTSSLNLTLRDTNTGQQVTGDASFTLMAAADVGGLKPGAIKHMAPAPFTRDAETTKFVHVDFHEVDLPWRYTPVKNGPRLRPWMVLLVGTGEEIQVAGSLASVRKEVLQAFDLEVSYLWAHTQFDGHLEISRILSPRPLEAQHEYVAVLVPAFNVEGASMWQANTASDSTLPALHSWRFWTAEAGDFETLAAALHIPAAQDAGKARLHYRRNIPAEGININETLEVRGAITSLQQPETPQQDEIDAVRADLDLLNDSVENAIGLPHYGRPWLPDPDTFPDGWPHDLNDDPRFRGITGLGVWMAVEAQEALMDAAVKQAGALREAGQQIGQLALGLWAAGRLWERRLPSDPYECLLILGPMMGRMLASGGGLVLDRVTSSSSPLPPTIFSSSAQRLLRNRSALSRHLRGGNGGIDRHEAMEEANQPELLPERAPSGLPHADSIAGELGQRSIEEFFELDEVWIEEVVRDLERIVRSICKDYRSERDTLFQFGLEDQVPGLRLDFASRLLDALIGRLDEQISSRGLPCSASPLFEMMEQELPGGIFSRGYLARMLEEDSTHTRFFALLRREIRLCQGRLVCPEINLPADLLDPEHFCDDLVGLLPAPLPPEQKPIDLGVLSSGLSSALDPRQPDAPARLRICSRIKGIDCKKLARPEFPIGLDFPSWDLLKKYDKEWLLPGAGKLEKDSITALQTNPAFIDAYMVGINTQFMSEMRWRDLAVDRTCTPLRMFWGQVNYATQKRQADIEPLLQWSKAPLEAIGTLSHQTIPPIDEDNLTGSRLVIAFRSDLFRRYPSTLVYLVRPPENATPAEVDDLLKMTPELDKPDAEPNAEQWRRDRKFFGPVFAGTLTQELTFFAFDVTPSELSEYWLVLDEPPAELRFRNDLPRDETNSASFATSTLDQPTRVAISGAELALQGLNP